MTAEHIINIQIYQFIYSTIVAMMIFMWGVDWSTHRSMTRDHIKVYGKGTYNLFLEMIKKYEWDWKDKRQRGHGSSLFLNAPDHLPTSTEIHASMIQFDSRGMLFGPIHFALFKYWQWKNIIIPRKFRRCSRCEDKLLCELDEKQWCISRRRDRKQIDWEREARAADKCL